MDGVELVAQLMAISATTAPAMAGDRLHPTSMPWVSPRSG